MPTQDVILGIIASTVMLCCMLSSVSMPLAVCRHVSNSVKAVEKAVEKAVAKVEAETVKAAGAEVTKVVSAVAASAEEEDSKRGKR